MYKKNVRIATQRRPRNTERIMALKHINARNVTRSLVHLEEIKPRFKRNSGKNMFSINKQSEN